MFCKAFTQTNCCGNYKVSFKVDDDDGGSLTRDEIVNKKIKEN
jgi:hypothetical protein